MFQKILAKFTIVSSIALVATPVTLIAAPAVHADTVPTAYSSITVEANNVSFKDLYDFTTDLHNDSSWFPNVSETVQTQDSNVPGLKTGIEYNQISFFNGFELDTHVVVKADVPNHLFYIEGTGPVANYNALYTFAPAKGGAGGTFTLTTQFQSQALTAPVLTFLLNQAMQNILTHFNTTGTVTLNYLNIV